MDTSTRLPGHGLLSEGRPHELRQGDEGDAPPGIAPTGGRSEGCGVCSCGAFRRAAADQRGPQGLGTAPTKDKIRSEEKGRRDE